MLNSRMMVRGGLFGGLMIIYGIIMLILGVGMIGQIFNVMMQASLISGFSMILIGSAMVYSGFIMTARRTRRTP